MATETIQIKASGMMCSFCTMSVENGLKKLPGVKSVMVNLVHGVILIDADTSLITKEKLSKEVEELGYPVSATESQQMAKNQAFHKMVRWRGWLGMSLSAIIVLVDTLNIFGLPVMYRTIFSLIVALFVLIWVGKPVLQRTLLVLKKGVVNANVLLSSAAWGSLIIGGLSLVDSRWPNFLPVAAWLMSLHIFSNYFKLGTNLKAAEAVKGLMNLQPSKATVIRGGGEVEVNITDISKGETVVIKPGERIPLDGEVIQGIASVDESSFTGESVPASKETGSKVIGGTLNLDGSLHILVTKVGEDTFLNQLIKLMSRVSDKKVPLELMADKIMNYYGPTVLILSALSFIGWLIATHDPYQATIVFLSVLIMGYPCALGMTTPMLAAIAGGKGISIGLLVKSGEVFQQLAQVDTVVFDKTGTLTYGRPTVTDVIPVGVEENQLLQWVSSIEKKSEHPLGGAIVFYAQSKNITPVAISDFRSTPGQGVKGTVEGNELFIGNSYFIDKQGAVISAEAQKHIDQLSSQGKTAILVLRDKIIIGIIALQDSPRKGIESLFQNLHARNINTVMLTGDSKAVAENIALQLGIKETHAQLLPEQKVNEIEKLQKAGKKVAMVGDGINDGPALLQSDVGIAVGAGTDVAIESAGVIIIGDRLNDVYNALVLGKASYRTMQINVAVAVLFNIVGILLAAFGYITPVFAILFMIVSIVGILANTLRVRALKLERSKPIEEKQTLAETELLVSNMVCEGCAERITSILDKVPGIHEIKPKVRQKHVYLKYEPSKIELIKIKEILNEEGYKAVEV
ncbi:MAG: heavy metal translocating P-type ATPase [Bacteroidota bacterium]|nr:heavy metal translocating P-type ATPase [Bacteroidota bacterium]